MTKLVQNEMSFDICDFFMLFFQPLYGIHPGEHIPFRFASGGGRELHFLEDKELEINEMVTSSTPRLPLQMTVKR